MENALQVFPHTDWPGDRRASNFEYLLDFVQQVDRITAFAIELVNESDNWRIAQAADFHQFDSTGLDPLGAINDH